ncbi:MAG: RNA polymerase sigma factor [Thermoanaerobaculia bacterium]
MTQLANPSLDERHFEAIYEQYFGLLIQIASFKFRVPESDAEALAHDVLIGYLRKSASVIDLRSWLIGAICYASRHYWRLNGRTVAVDEESEVERADPASLRIVDSLTDQLAAREALECLTPRCQEVLHMRYFEGCTIAEVAGRIGVKPKSAQKLITKCLRRAERLYNEKGRAR